MRTVMEGADEHRQTVLALIRTKSTLKAASIACGRNHGYFHQYLFQAKPKFLPEDVRLKLSQYLGQPEMRLKEPELQAVADRTDAGTDAARSRIPVYGRRIEGGVDLTAPVAEVDCPPVLNGVVDAFAAYVHDPVLDPCLPVGSLLYVNPAKPLRAGDFAYLRRDGIGRPAYFESHTPEGVRLLNGNGGEEVISTGEGIAIYKVVGADFP